MNEQEEYRRGRADARAEDEAELTRVLRGLVDNGEPRLSARHACVILAALADWEVAEAEFGEDPQIENVVNGLFGK